jgi:hypothetical protein
MSRIVIVILIYHRNKPTDFQSVTSFNLQVRAGTRREGNIPGHPRLGVLQQAGNLFK